MKKLFQEIRSLVQRVELRPKAPPPTEVPVVTEAKVEMNPFTQEDAERVLRERLRRQVPDEEAVRRFVGTVPEPDEFPAELVDRAKRLDELARELMLTLNIVRNGFFDRHPTLTHEERTYIATHASTDLIAAWYCTPEFVGNSNADMGQSLRHALDLFAHNFNRRQEALMENLGGYRH